ncbi:MAG: 16S rRNA (cytidine(1402)-2'-O)-methyltransferase [Steroidobacteraceae bacterium]
MTNQPAGRLYVVATPIGNLGDISSRALHTLRTCALIAAEDTRHTGGLLKHYGIQTPMVSLHDYNELKRSPELVSRMQSGITVALVSDAGTPGISDPGFDLVRACAAAGIEIVAIPGPCAAVAALSIAALPTDRFCFEGFLPARPAARRARLDEMVLEPRTLVFYESPHRVRDMLEDCARILGPERPATVAREITKLHETLYRDSLSQLALRAAAEADLARGEIVLVVAGAPRRAGELGDASGGLDRVLKPLLMELPLKQAARLAAQIASVRDNEAYKRALELKREAGS